MQDDDAAGEGDGDFCSGSDDSDTAAAQTGVAGAAATQRRPRLRHRAGRSSIAADAAAAAASRLTGAERESLNRQAVADAFRCASGTPEPIVALTSLVVPRVHLAHPARQRWTAPIQTHMLTNYRSDVLDCSSRRHQTNVSIRVSWLRQLQVLLGTGGGWHWCDSRERVPTRSATHQRRRQCQPTASTRRKRCIAAQCSAYGPSARRYRQCARR